MTICARGAEVTRLAASPYPRADAQMDDPLEALTRLRSHLADLQSRLVTQERELQGNTADIARAIGTQTRRARKEVERLNNDLKQVASGASRE